MKKMIILMAFVLLLMGCSDKATVEDDKIVNDEKVEIVDLDEVTENDSDNQGIEDKENTPSVNDKKWEVLSAEQIQHIKPNELGEVMVVMYHSLGEKNSAYVRTPDSFRKDLQTYYDMGFRPINLGDYVDGYIDVEAGYTPIVLTFDDGHKSNFNYIEKNGEMIIDPDCSVGILLEFHQSHPDWALKSSFFLNGGNPFGQKEFIEQKLHFLVDNGFEIGNHTYNHDDLTTLDAQQIQKTIGSLKQEVQQVLPNYNINTLALPFGKRPKDDKQRYNLITKGSYEGTDYEHKAILLVGWKPEVSVFDAKFNPIAIMRVQSGDGEWQMSDWLEVYRDNPKKRFISDGNPYVITIPRKLEDKLNTNFIENQPRIKDDVEIVVYDDVV